MLSSLQTWEGNRCLPDQVASGRMMEIIILTCGENTGDVSIPSWGVPVVVAVLCIFVVGVM